MLSFLRGNKAMVKVFRGESQSMVCCDESLAQVKVIHNPANSIWGWWMITVKGQCNS